MTWGMMYVLHGLAGVGLITLVMVHVYFAVRPEKLDITKSMIFGSMKRDFYLQTLRPGTMDHRGRELSAKDRRKGYGDIIHARRFARAR